MDNASISSNLPPLFTIIITLPNSDFFSNEFRHLAGLGILRVPWIPFGDPAISLVNLGDIAYMPYMVLVYPLWLAGIDVRITTQKAKMLLVCRLIHFIAIIHFTMGVCPN